MGLDNPIHIAILLVILLLVFGAKRLPEIGRSLGEGMRGFKDTLTGTGSEQDTLPAAPPPPPQQAVPATPAAPAVEQPVSQAPVSQSPTPEAH